MAKPKPPTPQELYRERKAREEREKTAYLPPGLINHGNTCFMNSVLQGLIATRLLSDLVHFYPIPPHIQASSSTPLLPQRSPQLTNGHNLAGRWEQPWVDSMPIGDRFLTVMYRAWESQAGRRREVLSPKAILAALGQKYDQYLDFAQQDAHEFLRILLDAMRMEEQDIIKKRQPPPPKKRRRTTITPSSVRQQSTNNANAAASSSQLPSQSQPNGHVPTHNGDARTSSDFSSSASTSASSSNPNAQTTSDPDTSPHEEPSEEDPPLLSFADMIFGGQLTSILVCQKCKHVSQTYEDFNDISLSIKAEDYLNYSGGQGRKRDRFRRMVGRLTAFPGTGREGGGGNSGQGQGHLRDPLKFAAQQLRAAATSSLSTSTSTPPATTTSNPDPAPAPAPPISLTHIAEIQRASSVPPSPRKEEKELAERDSKDEPRDGVLFDLGGARRRSLDLDVVRMSVDESSTSEGGGSPEITGKVPREVGVRGGDAAAVGAGEEVAKGEGGEAQQVVVNVTAPPEEVQKHVEFVEPVIDKDRDRDVNESDREVAVKDGKEGKEGKEGKKEKKEKTSAEDGWAKLGRRISLTVGLGRPKDKEKDKEKEKDRDRDREKDRDKDRDKGKDKERKDRDRKSRSMERPDRSGGGGGGLGFIREVMPEEMLKSFSSPSSSSSMLADIGLGGLGKKRVASDGGQPSSSWAEAQAEGEGASPSKNSISKPLPPQPSASSSSIPTTSTTSTTTTGATATTTSSSSTPQLLQPQPQPPLHQPQPHHHHHHHLFPHVQRSKSPKPPKPSAAETEYLRRILADVTVSSSSSSSSSSGMAAFSSALAGGAFSSIFRPALMHSHSSGPVFSSSGSEASWAGVSSPSSGANGTATGSTESGKGKEKDNSNTKEKEKEKEKSKATDKPSWLGMGMGLRSFTGLEECLRMFTAVEVLDGENMVGCRRCWKIQNGVYRTRAEQEEDGDGEDSDREEDDEANVEGEGDAEGEGEEEWQEVQKPTEDGLVEDVVTPRQPMGVVPPPPLPPPMASIPSTSSEGSGSTRPLHIPTSVSTPTVSASYYSQDTDGLSSEAEGDSRSVSSLPTEVTTDLGEKDLGLGTGGVVQGHGQGPGGMPIPVIETTAPDSPSPTATSAGAMEANRASAYARLTGSTQDAGPSSVSASGSTPKPSGTSVPAPHPRLTQALYGYKPTSGSASAPTTSAASGSRDSLVIPPIARRPGRTAPRMKKTYSYATTTTDDDESSEEEEGEGDSDTSAGTGTSVSADGEESTGSLAAGSRRDTVVNGQRQPALVASSGSTSGGSVAQLPQQQQLQQVQQFQGIPPPSAPSTPPTQTQPQSQTTPAKKPKAPKPPKPPKPTLMRPAYKRYLISIPPPVLVIHLKRFQQTSPSSSGWSSSPWSSAPWAGGGRSGGGGRGAGGGGGGGGGMLFSHGFKKLEDYVSFPEYLDLGPFLAPRKEDYGLGKSARKKRGEKGVAAGKGKGGEGGREERCMYRLYAVVVHIGNMLGGHYIAYTALPNESPVRSRESGAVSNSTAASSGPQPPSAPSTSTSTPAAGDDAGTGTSNTAPESVGDKEKDTSSSDPSQPSSQPPSSSPPSSSQAPPLHSQPSSSSTTTSSSSKPPERQWAYISDTVVRLTTLEEVLHAKAYICMYERC